MGCGAVLVCPPAPVCAFVEGLDAATCNTHAVVFTGASPAVHLYGYSYVLTPSIVIVMCVKP